MKFYFFIFISFFFFSSKLLAQDWIDLTYSFDEKTIYWPTHDGFELIEYRGNEKKLGYYHQGNIFKAPEHGGTHIDAPLHFNKFGKSVDQIPLEKLVGEGAIIDLSKKVGRNAHYEISDKDILDWEEKNIKLNSNHIVFLRTGWGKYWKNPKKYLGYKNKKEKLTLNFPGLSLEAAKLLIERKVKGVGIDTASLDPGHSQTFYVHRILMQNDIYGLENVAYLEKISYSKPNIIIAPMKISKGTGAPVRIFSSRPSSYKK